MSSLYGWNFIPVVYHSLPHMGGILQMRNLKLRESQWQTQSHSASKWQNRDQIPRHYNSESFSVPEINSFTLCHVHFFFMDIYILKEKIVHVQDKENIFYCKKNCTRMIKVSMVPQVILCTSKGIPVSNTKKKIGQILKLSSFYYFPFYLMSLSTAEHIYLPWVKAQKTWEALLCKYQGERESRKKGRVCYGEGSWITGLDSK